MKAAIMQPYLFPYIGYFQLMKEADVFISHDDIQYIKGGWINRNRILLNKQDYLYTFSLQSDSSSKNINERYFTSDFGEQCEKFLRMLQTAYANAPHFKSTLDLVERCFEKMNPDKKENIAVKTNRSIREIANYLKISCDFKVSSQLKKENNKNGEDRVIELCKTIGAESYVNPSGGKELYDQKTFEKSGIELSFLEPVLKSYPQFSEEFIEALSVIDLLMFNDQDQVDGFLNSYTLFKK